MKDSTKKIVSGIVSIAMAASGAIQPLFVSALETDPQETEIAVQETEPGTVAEAEETAAETESTGNAEEFEVVFELEGDGVFKIYENDELKHVIDKETVDEDRKIGYAANTEIKVVAEASETSEISSLVITKDASDPETKDVTEDRSMFEMDMLVDADTNIKAVFTEKESAESIPNETQNETKETIKETTAETETSEPSETVTFTKTAVKMMVALMVICKLYIVFIYKRIKKNNKPELFTA